MNSLMVNKPITGDNDKAALRAKLEKLNEEARENWDNPQWRRLMAQEISETIIEGFETENMLDLLGNVEDLPFDGRSFVKEIRGLRAFWIARGGFIEASTMRADVAEIQRDTIGFHVYEFEDKLRTNFGETQATLTDLGVQRLAAEINVRALKLFQAAIPNTSPYYISGAGLSLAALNTAIREVADVSRNGDIAIVGRRTMVDQIVDQLVGAGNAYAAFLPESNEDFLRRGVIGTYRGARVITLTNYKDDMDVPFFPANELFVIGRDAAKFAFFGGLLAKEWVEGDNWYWHYIARRDFGGLVYRPERARRIRDTSLAA